MEMTVHPYPLHPECPDVRRLADDPAEALLRAEADIVAAENAAEADRYRRLEELEEAQQDGRGVTRRTFVAGAAATATALATAQFVTTSASFAATKTGTLIHVFLYGGLDGLSLVAPADEPVLAKARPDLLLGADSLALGRGFKLTSAFRPLEKWLRAGQLGFVPAVSDERLSRSHFQAADACNLGGLPGETGGRGWLDSLVDALGKGTAFRSVGIGSTLPRSLVGTNGALSLNSVGSLRLNGDDRYREATEKAIRGLFTGINHPVQEAVRSGLGALGTAQKLAAKPYEPAGGVEYTGGVGSAFQQLAQLIKGGANVRVATVGMGGYDTHENQGTREGGQLHRRLTELAGAMAAFFTDLGDRAADVTVMVSSEFGRRVASNGGGTDHGHGGVVTVLSGRKLAGSLLGRWNGLSDLDSGDVPEYNNMFDVYGSVAQGRFGLTNAEVDRIFPRRTYTPMKLYA
ncbi:DUF1501 domain-containing protein [Micromonospora yangpuensis]|uniref:Uncharacterized conserved protein, DUF1501 family n=1 Tax=Micromonospora yangpuensis TaxID=683228 RepID=A0A1C6V1X7_9ACTN|nr:DUF1501 domain-containing protein [Micromonospora yangpuensis]GGL97990.1 hypothetical protein GCM10012279_14340 [Micromonospora yangpuensis]SCL60265.1 Uncharacterized conserved protein, DUF1501 family [Micromonospora yangpuensis]